MDQAEIDAEQDRLDAMVTSAVDSLKRIANALEIVAEYYGFTREAQRGGV